MSCAIYFPKLKQVYDPKDRRKIPLSYEIVNLFESLPFPYMEETRSFARHLNSEKYYLSITDGMFQCSFKEAQSLIYEADSWPLEQESANEIDAKSDEKIVHLRHQEQIKQIVHANNWIRLCESLDTYANKLLTLQPTADNLLAEMIHEGGFYAARGEKELLEEIDLRMSQYPGQLIYVFIGAQMEDYIKQFFPKGPKPGYVLPIISGRRYYNTSGKSCGGWESAVVAQGQLRYSSDIARTYDATKMKGYWSIVLNSVYRMVAYLDKRQETEKKLIQVVPENKKRAESIDLV